MQGPPGVCSHDFKVRLVSIVVFLQLLRCRVRGECNSMRAAGKRGRRHDYNGRIMTTESHSDEAGSKE